MTDMFADEVHARATQIEKKHIAKHFNYMRHYNDFVVDSLVNEIVKLTFLCI